MSKPSMNLESFLVESPVPVPEPGSQRSKRLSLEVDAQTYRRLRQCALDRDLTHQAILEKALLAFLDSNS